MNDSYRNFTPSLTYLIDRYPQSVLREYDSLQLDNLQKASHVIYDVKPYVIQFSPFDTKHLERKTGKIIRDNRYPFERSKDDINHVIDALKKERITYTTIRFSTDYIYAQLLEDMGFRLVDSVVYLYQHIDNHITGLSQIAIRPAEDSDKNKLSSITAGAFTYGRLYQDPLVTKNQADNVFIAWAGNALKRSVCDELLVALDDNNALIGYIGVKVLSRDESLPLASIELILIDKAYKGKGYSLSLINSAFDYCKKIGIRTILIDTQISNIPAIRSYTAAGFRFGATYLTYRIAL